MNQQADLPNNSMKQEAATQGPLTGYLESEILQMRTDILSFAGYSSSQGDILDKAGVSIDEMSELLQDHDFRIEYRRTRAFFRETIWERLLEKATPTQLLEIWLRLQDNDSSVLLKHPRELKPEDARGDEDVIIDFGTMDV